MQGGGAKWREGCRVAWEAGGAAGGDIVAQWEMTQKGTMGDGTGGCNWRWHDTGGCNGVA